MPVSCWAPTCNHTATRETCKFFRFPVNEKEFRKWIRLLRRDDAEPTPYSRVCSCHFREGKRENGPEIFEHNVSKIFRKHHLTPEKKKGGKSTRKQLSEAKASTSYYDLATPSTSFNVCADTLEPNVCADPMEPNVCADPMEPNVFEAPIATTSKAAAETSVTVLEAEIYLLKLEIERKDEIIKTLKLHFSYEQISNRDDLVLEYTGLPTNHVFQSLAQLLENLEINYYSKWKVQKISKVDQLLLTLMKLRQNFTHTDLAFRFQISVATVTNIVVTFIHVLHEVLYKQLMCDIPKRTKNRSCLPNCCSTFTNCRIIIDCTEIFSAVPRHSLKLQRETYSSYKHRNTWKGLIGVAPNGVITYASYLYPGSTSDRKVVEACEVLKQMEPGDLILADKGFLIKDLLPAGVNLNIPPFLVTPQFNEEQIRRTECIARARIHVERAIQRVKCYKILDFIPLPFFSYGSIIFKCICALTNLQYPLIKEVEQYYCTDK